MMSHITHSLQPDPPSKIFRGSPAYHHDRQLTNRFPQRLPHRPAQPARFGHDTIGVSVPSKSRNRIRRFIEFAASLARSGAMGSSRHALQVIDFNINIAQAPLSPLIEIVPAEMVTHQPHPLSSFIFRHRQRSSD